MNDKKRFQKLPAILVCLLALTALPQVALGQSGKISGRIIDAETNEPLPGANVRLEGTVQGASSDVDGYYFILNVPPGTYDVTATFMGYQTVTQTGVKVDVDKTTPVDFTLTPAVFEGEEITITATRPPVQVDRTSTEQVVSEESIAQAPVQSIDEVVNLQAGIHEGRFRGGDGTEVVYLLDNINLNSGLIADNYTGMNLTTVQEISVLTGGYNAEYGNAQSAIINVITKGESATRFGGTFVARLRPAGKYHYGRYFYSEENYDWKNFDLDYWTKQSQDPNSEFYGEDPQSLLQAWRKQITPNDTLARYTERPEWESEMTLYGPLTRRLSFMASGRYKQGVNIFPQFLPYNPEYNFQGKLTYALTDRLKLKLNGLYGGSESVTGSSNFNTEGLSPEMAWTGPMQVTDPYGGNKYLGVGEMSSWPRLRKVGNVTAELTHVLSAETFYNLQASYLSDVLDASDRYGIVPDDKWAFDANEYDMLGHYIMGSYLHNWDLLDSKVLTFSGDVTSQVTRNHQLKAGAELRFFDLFYEHAMMAFEGGERWNLVNKFDGNPYEGNLYAQDKIEFGGLIMNAGLRLDFFHQNREAPSNMFDPLAFQETTEGNLTPGIPGKPTMVPTELQVALAPRLGFSHPITENSVLHFYYGHFYQRPAWNTMFGFPFINFTTDMEKALDPYSGVETYMDQWQGYYGNPRMGYAKTVQYEIGINNNIEGLALLSLTGYYKDASRQASTWTWLYNMTNQYNIPIMIANGGFADHRGIEARIDTRFNFPLNFMLTYDISYDNAGAVGYNSLYENDSGVNSPIGYGQDQYPWSSLNRAKGLANLVLPAGFGPTLLGVKPLQDLSASLYFEWEQGRQYTYHGPGDPSTKPNNMRWEDHFTSNLRARKGFTISGVRSELSVEVRNLFNNKDLNMLWGDDLQRYHEREGQPLEERLPKHWWSEEPNEWGWYNVWRNPPRQVYLQLRVDF